MLRFLLFECEKCNITDETKTILFYQNGVLDFEKNIGFRNKQLLALKNQNNTLYKTRKSALVP